MVNGVYCFIIYRSGGIMDLSRTSSKGYDISLTEWKDLVDESEKS